MDEDKFYYGETLDGQTGLVPSNYVERVPNQQLLSTSSRARSSSFSPAVPQHDFSTSLAPLSGIVGARNTIPSITQPLSTAPSLPDSVCPYPPVDIAKVTMQEVKITDNPRGKFFLFLFSFFFLH